MNRLIGLWLAGVLAVVAWSVLWPSAPEKHKNQQVSEHTFCRLQYDMMTADVVEVLGEPTSQQRGHRRRYNASQDPFPSFLLSLRDNAPDLVLLYDGEHDEQIRVLMDGKTHRSVAAEYLVDGSPVFFWGSHDEHCEPLPAIARFEAGVPHDPKEIRKKQLLRFLTDNCKPRAPDGFMGEPVAGSAGGEYVTPTPVDSGRSAVGSEKTQVAWVGGHSSVVSEKPAQIHPVDDSGHEEPKVVQPTPAETTVKTALVGEPPAEKAKVVQAKAKPDQDVRTWTYRTGRTIPDAEFVSLAVNKVKLRVPDGETVIVDRAALSDADRDWLKARSHRTR